jgi:hypothetical protein
MLGISITRLKWLIDHNQLHPVDTPATVRGVRVFAREAIEEFRDQSLVPLFDAAAMVGWSTSELLRAARSAGLQHRRLRTESGQLRYFLPASFLCEVEGLAAAG